MQPRRVHHHEHRRQASVGLTNQPALCLLEHQRTGRAALDPHLVFDTVATHAVDLMVIQQLGHQKQRNAPAASGRTGQSCQHQMQDICAQVVIATGDKQLAAAHTITAVVLRFGTTAQQADVAACLRFGQAHGGQDFTADNLRQITRLDPLRGMGLEAQIGTVGDAGVHGPAMVAGIEHLLQRRVE